jgi:hypothetical protein
MEKTFTKPTLLVILFLITIGLRIEQKTVYYDLGFDKTRQIIASGNYIKGNGISDCTTAANDLSQVKCEPQTWWAMGYPFVLSYLHYFTGDFLVSDFILICFGLVVFFLSAYFIFENISYSARIVSPFHLFLIFSAFSFAPYQYLTTTDLLSIAFFTAGCAFSVNILKNEYVLPSILTGFFFFLTGFFKYSFYPFLTIVPIVFGILFLLKREKKFVYSIIFYFATILACFGLIWLFFPNHLVNQQAKGLSAEWNWQHLLEFDAFGLKAFFFLDPILSKFELQTATEIIIRLATLIASTTIIITFIGYGLSYANRIIPDKNFKSEGYIYLLGIVTVIINILYLMWLSVRLPVFPQPNNPIWTFVWETRYYIPAMFFLQVFIFSIFFKLEKNPRLKIIAGGFVLLTISYAFTYWSWKKYDVFVNKRLDGTYYAESEEKLKIGSFLKSELSKESRPVVLGFLNYGEGYGATQLNSDNENAVDTLTDGYVNINKNLRSSDPVIYYFILPNKFNSAEKDFLTAGEATKVLALSKSDLFRIEIKPNLKVNEK